MARYFYKAVNTEGRVVEGHLEAVNEADLELRVSHMDLDLIRYKVEGRPLLFQRGRVDIKELINFTYHLQQLLSAGVPIIDALQDLRDSTDDPAFRDVVAGIVESIGTGRTFSEALTAYPRIFSPVYVSMAHVGETSGQLDKVLRDLRDMLRWHYELASQARKMLVYPTFVLVVVVLVVIFLMLYLVPQLIPFLKLAGEEIPWHTQLLIDTSGFFSNYWPVLLSLPVAIVAVVEVLAAYNSALRLRIDAIKFKIPVIGSILYKVKLARFCNYFALMYASGITVLDAIAMGKRVINNRMLEHALETVHGQIADGESISASFANVGLFPALVVRMLKVGENTGDMSASLLNVSYFYEREVKDAVDSIEPVITPAITVFLGAIVAWIVLSIMGPVYDAVVSLSAL